MIGNPPLVKARRRFVEPKGWSAPCLHSALVFETEMILLFRLGENVNITKDFNVGFCVIYVSRNFKVLNSLL